MSDKTIQLIIDKLNNQSDKHLIFTKKISLNVDIAIVWQNEPEIIDDYSNDGILSDKFFFIKNNEGKYIAAVIDRSNDLHWFVTPKYRKQGHLIKALKTAILPYIFEEKEEQRITISKHEIGKINYENSKRVAELLGFKSINNGENEFILKSFDFDFNDSEYDEVDTILSEERTNELRKEVYFLARRLQKVHDELSMNYGYNEEIYELSEMARKIKNYTWKLEDMRYFRL